MKSTGGYIIIPKELLYQRESLGLSVEAVLLYALLIDRYKLSAQNGLLDPDGRVYVIFSREEAASRLGISLRKCSDVFSQLINAGLLYEKRRGKGLAHLLYPYYAKIADNDVFCASADANFADTEPQNSTPAEKQNLLCNNKEYNKNNFKNNNLLSLCSSVTRAHEQELERIIANCDFSVFTEQFAEFFKKIIRRMFYCRELKNGPELLPQSEIRYILKSLTTDHLIEAAERLYENDSDIINTSAFIMSMLVNIITADDIANLINRPPEFGKTESFFVL